MKKVTQAAAAALALGISAPASAETLNFSIVGAYSFADTHDIMQPTDGVIARAGRLVGSWQLRETGGKTGNAHINAATAVRIVPGEQPSLMGTMEIAMSEYENTAPGSDVVYLAYEATSFAMTGPNITTITVEGRIVGGRGKYQGARGTLRVVSVNGFISDGRAVIQLNNR